MRYEARLRKIQCKKLHEGSDEIYYQLDGVDQRPAGDPDYWLFEEVSGADPRRVDRRVLVGAGGTTVTLRLMEQDAFGQSQHDLLGEVVLRAKAGKVAFEPTVGTTYRGLENGFDVVDFHAADGVYALHFKWTVT